jgi:hypothetical protein
MSTEKTPSSATAATDVSKVPAERQNFKAFLLSNANYFGNLAESPAKPVKKIVTNTTYEQLTCVGYNPETSFLEATIAVKLPTGYGGDLCSSGSTEFVRFFIDYGAGWEDAGLAGVTVHDIPTGKDCADKLNKPLLYAANLRVDPKRHCCNAPLLPKVHAILSWQWAPPAGPANVGWTPVWGNTLDCQIQIKPRPWNLFCLFDIISASLPQKIKIPQLFEEVQFDPIPQPDPPPFTIGQLAELYGQKGTSKASAAASLSVSAHRFGVHELSSIVDTGVFTQELVTAKTAEWAAAGLDLAGAIAALLDTSADVNFEELECLGLDEGIPERLVGTFRIKRPLGYSGDLCHPGSKEYVAFWADWDNTCEYTYLGTVQVNVHDIPSIPKEGLCYSAILPVDLTKIRQSCKKPKIARVRAVLSWNVPPSTTDPNKLNFYGNRLDAHVQINPAEPGTPENPEIRNIGGIPVEFIDTPGLGLTLSGVGAAFAHYPGVSADALDRQCPFGGNLYMDAEFYQGLYYRVRVRKSSNHLIIKVLDDSFPIERWVHPPTFDTQIAVGGFFKYLNKLDYVTRTIAVWSSGALALADKDDLWEMQLDVATAPNVLNIIGSSPWYRVQLDNTGPVGPPASPPTMDIHIAMGGDCKDFTQDSKIDGTFIANDPYFGSWSLSTEPNTFTTPSNQPQAITCPPPANPALANTSPAPAPGGHDWCLDTLSPIEMKPCGYVVRLDVSDRSIVHSVPYVHNSNHIEVGFCLRAK